MIYRFNAKHLAICLSLSVLFSCKKDDNATPTPTPPEETNLFTQVQGRWNAEVDLSSGKIRSNSASLKQQGQDTQFGTIEFFSDSTYVIAYAGESMALSGKFTIDNDSTISINSFMGDITINKVKVANNVISFDFPIPQNPEESISVQATKAENLTIAENKKGLLYKNWLVEKDLADGVHFYQSASAYGDDVKAFFYFSPSGSLLFKVKMQPNSNLPSGMPLEMVIFTNWKWHVNSDNTAVSYPLIGADGNETELKITSLTNTTLKLEQTYPGSGQQVLNLVLTAQ